VVWRPGGDAAGEPLIVLVHRQCYDDWSLPKGKLLPREHPVAAAVREVSEETAVVAAPRVRLPDARYLVPGPGRRGAPVRKTVEYWSMRACAWADRPPDDEVDLVRWVPVTAAGDLLSYRHDLVVVRAFTAVGPVTGVVAVVRRAGSIADLLALLRPTRIVSGTGRSVSASATAVAAATAALAAVPTGGVPPGGGSAGGGSAGLARTVGGGSDPRFDAGAGPAVAADAVRALGATGGAAVVCCRGRLIPPLVAALTGTPAERFPTPRGVGWIVGFAGEAPVAVSRIAAGA
jgi:8-oxo-dGTP diphosphatase